MPDPFAPEGALPSFLRSIDRPGQAIRNVLRGDLGAAGRQVGSLIGDIVDAPLPGDWIPDFTEKQDYVSAGELVGMDEGTPWYIKAPVDIAGGILTDPLSWVSFGAPAVAKTGAAQALRVGVPFTRGVDVATFSKEVDPLSLISRSADTLATKGAQGIDAAIGKAFPTPGNVSGAAVKGATERGYDAAKHGVKRTLGWFELKPDQKRILSETTAEGQRTSKVWVDASRKAMEGLTDAERTALGDAFDGLDWGTLAKTDATSVRQIPGSLSERIQFLADTHKLDATKLQAAAQEISRIGSGQFNEAIAKGVLADRGIRPEDYLQRQFIEESSAKATEGRVFKTPDELAAGIREMKGAAYERDAGVRLINRAIEQGRSVEKAAIGRSFAAKAGKTLNLTNPEETKAVSDLIKEAAESDPDFGYLAKQIWEGMPERGWTEPFAKANRLIKPAMVYGVVVPKVGSIVRNQIGMLWQAASTPGVKVSDLGNPLRNLYRSFDDAWLKVTGKAGHSADELGKDMDLMEAAHAWAGQTGRGGDGVIEFLQAQKRPDLADAVRLGVMDGFVSSEDILKEMTRSTARTKWSNLYDAPGVIFQGVEQRGRLSTFKAMRERGIKNKDVSPELAAEQTKDAFLNYRITGPENRTLRDIIPFAQFAAQSIRQQARAISTKPVIGTTAAQMFQTGEEDPVYPWMEDKSRINLGLDEQGNPLWLTGLGLPIESLGMIPNVSGDLSDLSKSLRQGALGSTQPLLKTAAAITTGRDPYFDTPFGSYEKLPIVGEAGGVGAGINMLAGTGFLEPLGFGAVRQVGTALDETKPGFTRALDLLTGGKLVSVDPDRAEQLQIQDYLSGRPDIKTYQTYFKTEEDPEFSQLMSELRAAKARVKEKREAAAAAGL